MEAKQVAQQEAERAKFIVEKAMQEKEGAIVRAQGEAQSARLIGQAIAQNPAFLTLRKIEVGGARLHEGSGLLLIICNPFLPWHAGCPRDSSHCGWGCKQGVPERRHAAAQPSHQRQVAPEEPVNNLFFAIAN